MPAYEMRKLIDISEGKPIRKYTLIERRQKLREFLQVVLPMLGLLARGVSILRATPAARTALQTAVNTAKAGAVVGEEIGAGGILTRRATLGGVAAIGGELLSGLLETFFNNIGLIDTIITVAVKILPEILSYFESHNQEDKLETIAELSQEETIVICKKMLINSGSNEKQAQEISEKIVKNSFNKEKKYPAIVAMSTIKAIIDESRDHQGSHKNISS